jgi:hypothetical protein
MDLVLYFFLGFFTILSVWATQKWKMRRDNLRINRKAAPVPSKGYTTKGPVPEVQALLDGPFTLPHEPLEITLPSKGSPRLAAGERLELIFKTKESYLRDEFLRVHFSYQGQVFGYAGAFYDKVSPILTMIRAHLNGYEVVGKIANVRGELLTVRIQIKQSEEQIKRKVPRVTTGTFTIEGFERVPQPIQEWIASELKMGAELQLMPEPGSDFDPTGLKVFFDFAQIGWVGNDCGQRYQLLQALHRQKNLKVTCLENEKFKDTRLTIGKDGNLMMEERDCQHIRASFEMEEMP